MAAWVAGEDQVASTSASSPLRAAIRSRAGCCSWRLQVDTGGERAYGPGDHHGRLLVGRGQRLGDRVQQLQVERIDLPVPQPQHGHSGILFDL